VETGGLVKLIFSNTGDQGAVFHVYDQLRLDRIPRRYTVEAGKTLTDVWDVHSGGAYDLWVYSANGFLRTFRGNALAHVASAFRPEVQVCYEITRGAAYLKVHNRGVARGEVAIRPNAYRDDGPWLLTVNAGATGTIGWDVAASGCWYDFSVDAEHFERRFAGRVETGRHGVSDPAMGQELVLAGE
jgi:phospholipase C